MIVLELLVVFGFALGLRLVPHWLAPQGAGVDHWFWRTYVETYRREGVFPPVLPKYILDEHQWYPPLFGLALSKLPASVLDRSSHQVAIAIDLLRMVLLVSVAAWQSAANPNVMVVAALIYATTPIQISYNVQLNPRGVAAILLDLLLIGLLWGLAQQGGWLTWCGVLLLGALILLTHKMTTQLLVFITLGTAIVYGRPALLMLIPGWVSLAWLISGGFYTKILRAHIQIVQFWHRNWRWIGADLLRESPIYGDGSYERPEKLHKPGLRGLRWHGFILMGFNPAAWIACVLVYERLFAGSAMLIYPTPLLVWLLLPCMWALATSFLAPLKRFGAGYLYVYNTSVMASLVLGLTFEYTRAPGLSWSLVAAALTLNMVGVLVYFRQFLRDRRTRIDEGLEQMLNVLRGRPPGVVMCVPTNWCEVVAYRTPHSVLWGGHGYGFNLLEPTWPRLLLPIKEAIRRYDVRYLLCSDESLPANFIADLPDAELIRLGAYRLYCFSGTGENSEPTRAGAFVSV